MLEQGAPARRLGGREVEIGKRHAHQPRDRGIWPLGRLAGAVGGDQVAFQRRERARVHQQHEVVEILDHVVDRPDRAADLLGERARSQGPSPCA